MAPPRPRRSSTTSLPPKPRTVEARAAEDATEIRSHVMPDTGTSVTANPDNNPVMKTVERLAGKGVN